jgi:hypothetical protein
MALACFKIQHSHSERYRHLLPEGETKTLCGRVPDRSYAPFDVWPEITFQWETCLTCLSVGKARFGGDPATALPHHATAVAHAEAMKRGEIKRRVTEAAHRADMARWAAEEAARTATEAERAAAEAQRLADEAVRNAGRRP